MGYKCSGARDRNRTGTPVIHEAADFKSDVSTYFTTRARLYCETKKPRCCNPRGFQKQIQTKTWRRDPESNWARRICKPKHNRFSIATKTLTKKGSIRFPFLKLGAGKETRTLDLYLGKVSLYQLSYSRIDTGRSLRKKKHWSGKRDSNSRPIPWQGIALPTELFPRFKP